MRQYLNQGHLISFSFLLMALCSFSLPSQAETNLGVSFRFEDASRKAAVSYAVNDHVAIGAGALYSNDEAGQLASQGGYALLTLKEKITDKLFYLNELDLGYQRLTNRKDKKAGALVADLSMGLAIKESFTETSFGVVLNASRLKNLDSDNTPYEVGISPFMAFSVGF